MTDFNKMAKSLIAGTGEPCQGYNISKSSREDHRKSAISLISLLEKVQKTSNRIGLSGTPGVGKSTF